MNPRSVRTRVGAIAPLRWLVSTLSVVWVLITATFVGTNLITAIPPGASPITVTFNYNGATGGNTLASATVTPGASADSVLPFPTKSGLDFSGWFNPQSLLNGQRITTIGEGDAGQLQAGYVPPELAQTLNLVLPPAPCAQGGACTLGDIGPGGGLVFLISSGLTYEMAPTNWNDPTNPTGIDPTAVWTTTADKCYMDGSTVADQNCQSNNLYPETTSGAQTASTIASEAIGMGSVNTAAIKDRMVAGSESANAYAAGLASAYTGGGFTDWFLPSKDELNAMCNYSRNPTTPPTVACAGGQDIRFVGSEYGFTSNDNPFAGVYYWSSSQSYAGYAWAQDFIAVPHFPAGKNFALLVRPVRSF